MKRPSFKLAITTVAIGIGLPAGVLAQQGTTAVAAAVEGPVVAVETTSISGEVTAIDRAKRQVAVKGDNGRMASLYVGQNVRNLENLKLGDRVTARYTEAMALAIAKGGNESQIGEIRTKVEADAARQAAHGGKPGMSAIERTTLVANVFEIDREKGILTLRGTDGVPVDVKVPDKKALDQIKLNDQIVIGYRQSGALSIEPGSSK